MRSLLRRKSEAALQLEKRLQPVRTFGWQWNSFSLGHRALDCFLFRHTPCFREFFEQLGRRRIKFEREAIAVAIHNKIVSLLLRRNQCFNSRLVHLSI